MNLVFVRHGQSIWNLENKFTGWVDVGLSENGIEEAIQAGKTLKKNNFIPEICMTSFLERSKVTANLIIENLDNQKPIFDILSSFVVFPMIFYHAKFLEMERWLKE